MNEERRYTVAFAGLMAGLIVVAGAWVRGLDLITFDGFLDYARDSLTIRQSGIAAVREPLHPVGYNLLLLAVEGLAGSLFEAGKWISLSSGLGSIGLLFLITRRLYGARLAFFTALLSLPLSCVLVLALEPSSIALTLLLQLGAAYFFLGERRGLAALLAGVLLGLAQLIRYSTIVVYLAFFLWSVFSLWKRKRDLLVQLALVTAPFLLISLPQVWINLEKGIDPFLGNNPGSILEILGEKETMTASIRDNLSVVSVALIAGSRMLGLWLENFLLFLAFNAVFVAALVFEARRRRCWEARFIGTLYVFHTIVICQMTYGIRHHMLTRMLALPLVVGAAAHLWPALVRAWRRPSRRHGAAQISAAAGMGILIALLVPPLLGYAGFRHMEMRSMLGRDEIGTTTRLITRRLYETGYRSPTDVLSCSTVHYDARAIAEDRFEYFRNGLDGVDLPTRFPDARALEHFMRGVGFRYVLYDEEKKGRCPEIGFLFDPSDPRGDLVPLLVDDFYNQTDRIALYRLRREGEPEAEPSGPATRPASWYEGSLVGFLDRLERETNARTNRPSPG